MAHDPHDRSLRQALDALAAMAPSDRDEIMALLTPFHRLRLERLAVVAERNGLAVSADALMAMGLSRWLAELGAGGSRRLTPATQAMLQDCVQTLFGQVGDRLRDPAPSLAHRIAGLFRRKGALL